MRHEIKVVFDTETGKIEVDTGDTEGVQAASIMLTGAKKMRQAEGVLQVVVTKDVKTQIVALEFQADEILQWSEVLGMLEQAKTDASFKQWFQMFMLAQQNMAQQAQAVMQNTAIAQQLKGNGRSKLVI